MNRNLLIVLIPFSLSVAACAVETSAPTEATDPAAEGDEDTAQTNDELVSLTYANVKSIIDSTCGGCHAQFTSLAGIKADKTAMAARIKAGSMPRGNPTWKSTADGKKVLKWLKSGKDLK